METPEIKQALDEIMVTLHQYLQRALPEAKGLADQFYRAESNAIWSRFADLIEGVEWIFQVFDSMFHVKMNPPLYAEWEQYETMAEQLKEQMKGLEGAVETKDLTLIGDLLHYEILPILEQLQAQVGLTVETEVVRDDT